MISFSHFFSLSFQGVETLMWGNYNSYQCLISAEQNCIDYSLPGLFHKIYLKTQKKCLKMFLSFLFIFGGS